MTTIFDHVRTPAIEDLVAGYGDRLQVMSSDDLRSFLHAVVWTLTIDTLDDPDATSCAIQAWVGIYKEPADTLTLLVIAVCSIQLENAAQARLMLTAEPGEVPF